MTARRLFPYLAVALPPLVLAAIGVTHPTTLTAESAEYWRNLHIASLPLFPLLGFAPWLIVRGSRPAIVSLAGILGFVYAVAYTGLDVLAGIGAGGLKLDDFGEATGTVFGLGNVFGRIGAVAFVAACLLAAGVAIYRAGPSAVLGGLAVVVGSLLLLRSHIYFPFGVLGQLLLAAGWVITLIVLERKRRVVDADGIA